MCVFVHVCINIYLYNTCGSLAMHTKKPVFVQNEKMDSIRIPKFLASVLSITDAPMGVLAQPAAVQLFSRSLVALQLSTALVNNTWTSKGGLSQTGGKRSWQQMTYPKFVPFSNRDLEVLNNGDQKKQSS